MTAEGKRHGGSFEHLRDPEPRAQWRACGGLAELYDIDKDPYEITNLKKRASTKPVEEKLQRELKRLTTEARGLR